MSTYESEWYDKKRTSKQHAAREVVPLVMDLVGPRSVVDLGCGDGTWLSVFAEENLDAYLGIDGDWIDRESLQIPSDNFRVFDLTKPLDLDRTFDLAVSLEVAEHLPQTAAETFVGTLTSLAPVVLFSAAVPHQGGTHHVNEQWQQYWAERFRNHGFSALTTLRRQLWTNDAVHDFYRQNLILYVADDVLDDLGVPETDVARDLEQLSVVHPAVFERKMTRFEQAQRLEPGTISLRDILRSIPKLVYSAIQRRIGSREKQAG